MSSKLNRDILYLIFEKLQDDKKTLYSSLSVNKTCCEIIIPILWRNPWKHLTRKKRNLSLLLFNVIISHLSDESKSNLKFNQSIDFLIISYQKPLFNYISFCKHLNLKAITKIINISCSKYEINLPIVKNEIFKLFINENTRFTHLYLPQHFDYQLHLIPGVKQCFSEIVFFSCLTRASDEVLIGLAEICQSINKLELFIESGDYSYGITKLIDASKKLIDVSLSVNYVMASLNILLTGNSDFSVIDKTFLIILENSLMKHTHTIQYFKMTAPPATRILSSLINLKGLDLSLKTQDIHSNTNLENLSLPNLQILKSNVLQNNILRNLIINANRSLTKLNVDNNIPHNEVENKSIIQAIYQNCPNLMYLKLMFRSENILELEQLLINCKYLNGIYFLILYLSDLDKLFEMLTTSSPTNLSKFKFDINSYEVIKLESLKLFFDSWKGRNPMLLQISDYSRNGLKSFIEEYRSKGIVKKFNYLQKYSSEVFEW
jgi:hypothetical protein